ncbi:hypothetical protein AVEN_36681-1 [Araneus ventricosus]|uniref:Uncharacterized protein n=1 Tax=Araneus ventricosus TaxID=182803 RepID=A0A4Y2MTD5_ARAVE|nr:hypothetical protein AVEN_36681-1 [Araneus ventricosus]
MFNAVNIIREIDAEENCHSVDNFQPAPSASNNQNLEPSSNISQQELSNIDHSYSSNTLQIYLTNMSAPSPSNTHQMDMSNNEK